MISKVYSVYDSKVECYLPPFYMKSKGEAIRAFTEAANNSDQAIGKWSADYTLFELGTFDDSNACFSMHKTPISCGVALEFVKS